MEFGERGKGILEEGGVGRGRRKDGGSSKGDFGQLVEVSLVEVSKTFFFFGQFEELDLSQTHPCLTECQTRVEKSTTVQAIRS